MNIDFIIKATTVLRALHLTRPNLAGIQTWRLATDSRRQKKNT